MTKQVAEIESFSIARVTVASEVAGVLRRKILDGHLQPGAHLPEVSLAVSAGVSRNSLREAIQILVREGLVRHTKHHGTTVTQLNAQELRDIYQTRRCLEAAAVRASVTATADQLGELERAVEAIGTAAKEGDWLRAVSHDLRFHRTLVGFLGSQRLNSFYDALLSELRLGLVLVDRASLSGSGLISQHAELLRLIRTGKTDECVVALLRHLDESEQSLREVISGSKGTRAETLASLQA